jgi:hypothetical protein
MFGACIGKFNFRGPGTDLLSAVPLIGYVLLRPGWLHPKSFISVKLVWTGLNSSSVSFLNSELVSTTIGSLTLQPSPAGSTTVHPENSPSKIPSRQARRVFYPTFTFQRATFDL